MMSGINARPRPLYAFRIQSAPISPIQITCNVRADELTSDSLLRTMLDSVQLSKHDVAKVLILRSRYAVGLGSGLMFSLDDLVSAYWPLHEHEWSSMNVTLVPWTNRYAILCKALTDDAPREDQAQSSTDMAKSNGGSVDSGAMAGTDPLALYEGAHATAAHSPAAAATSAGPTDSTGSNNSTDTPNIADSETQSKRTTKLGEEPTHEHASGSNATPLARPPSQIAAPAEQPGPDMRTGNAVVGDGDADEADDGSCCQLSPNANASLSTSPDENLHRLEAGEDRREGSALRSVETPQSHREEAEESSAIECKTDEAVTSHEKHGPHETIGMAFTAKNSGSGDESTDLGDVQPHLAVTCRYGVPEDNDDASRVTSPVVAPAFDDDEDEQKLQRIKTRNYLDSLESDDRNTTASTRLLRIIRDEGVAPASQLGLKLLDMVQALRIDGELGPARMDEGIHAVATAAVQPVQQRLDQFAEMLDHIAFACGVNVVEPDENGDTPAVTPRPSETPLRTATVDIDPSAGKTDMQGGLEAVVELQPAQRELLDVLASPRGPGHGAGDNEEDGTASLDESGLFPLARDEPATALTPKQQLKRVLGAAQGMQDVLPTSSPYTRVGNQVLSDPASLATPPAASPRTIPPSRVHQQARPELAGYNLSRNYLHYPHGPGFSYPHHASHPAWTSHERQAMPSPFSGEPAPVRASPLHPAAESYARRSYARRSYHMWHSSHFGPRTTHPGGMQSADHPSPYGHPGILPGAGVEHGFRQAFPAMPYSAASEQGGMYSYMP